MCVCKLCMTIYIRQRQLTLNNLLKIFYFLNMFLTLKNDFLSTTGITTDLNSYCDIMARLA